jgi:hypothetical protein
LSVSSTTAGRAVLRVGAMLRKGWARVLPLRVPVIHPP